MKLEIVSLSPGRIGGSRYVTSGVQSRCFDPLGKNRHEPRSETKLLRVISLRVEDIQLPLWSQTKISGTRHCVGLRSETVSGRLGSVVVPCRTTTARAKPGPVKE